MLNFVNCIFISNYNYKKNKWSPETWSFKKEIIFKKRKTASQRVQNNNTISKAYIT